MKNHGLESASLLPTNEPKCASLLGNSTGAVKEKQPVADAKNLGVSAFPQSLLDSGLIPVDRAAEALGIEPKRLLGFMARNKVGDPIGDGKEVYGWSCATLAASQTVQSPAQNANCIQSDATRACTAEPYSGTAIKSARHD